MLLGDLGNHRLTKDGIGSYLTSYIKLILDGAKMLK